MSHCLGVCHSHICHTLVGVVVQQPNTTCCVDTTWHTHTPNTQLVYMCTLVCHTTSVRDDVTLVGGVYVCVCVRDTTDTHTGGRP